MTKEQYEECRKVAKKYPEKNDTGISSTEMRGCNDCMIIREYLSKCEQYGCDSRVAETYCIFNNLRTDRYPGEMCERNLLEYLDSK